MANTIIIEALLQKETIRLKDKMSIIKQMANTKYEGSLRSQGDTVTVETFPNIFGTISASSAAGGAITTQDVAITSQQLVVNLTWQNGSQWKEIERIQSNLDLLSRTANRFAFASAQHEDQAIAGQVPEGLTANKIGYQAPITLAASNTYSTITQLTQKLEENNAFGVKMLFVNPQQRRWLKLDNSFDANDTGAKIRLNGRVGTIDGYQVMVTNNLPHARKLTMPTIPVAADTFTMDGLEQDTTNGGYKVRTITFTWKAAASAANPGDISIGANVAASQQNFIDAINGTGTPAAGTYIEMDPADRQAFRNAFVKCETAWTSDVINNYSSTTMAITENVTPADFAWGDDATLMFAADQEAINAVFQMDRFKVADLQDRFAQNVLQEKVYGLKVFTENNKGISSAEIKVI